MPQIRVLKPLLLGVSLLTLVLGASGVHSAGEVDFVHDVQPILKAHCTSCHGDNSTAAGLDLRSYESLMKGGISGKAVAPKSAKTSLLLNRILGIGGERMPMGFAPLDDAKVATIRAWIDQGALPSAGAKKAHWAFVKPVKPMLPKVSDPKWVRNPIDTFVLARLDKEGLKPSPRADKTTLLRRLTLDLTGLPPSPQEVDAFNADQSQNAYEKVVDRLLASPHFGERMALPWLDAARYADSNGFQQDGDNYQYVWRDWVVRAYNADMPFGEFTVEQVAGDLLPVPTIDQLVATAFNRNHMLNGEGGAIPEEQRNVVLFDRVDVTSTTWLALTMACARCHDHKYDPVSQRDYYSLMAYFNNVPETGVPPGGGQYRIADPWIAAGSPAEMQRLSELQNHKATLEKRLAEYEGSTDFQADFAQWHLRTMKDIEAGRGMKPGGTAWMEVERYEGKSFDDAYDHPLANDFRTRPGRIDHREWKDGVVVPLSGNNTSWTIWRMVDLDRECNPLLAFGSDDAIKVWWNGKLVHANKTTRGVVLDQDLVKVQGRKGLNDLVVQIVNGGDPAGFVYNIYPSGVLPQMESVLAKPSSQWAEGERKLAIEQFKAATDTPYRKLRDELDQVSTKLAMEQEALPKVMVMSDKQPRKTHVLTRGDYEKPAEEVGPRPPDVLPAIKGALPNRLGLAMWLVSDDNPLTARVAVNRVWQMLFGHGLVRTSENFGVQGEPPTHPDLLDWLAVDFRESGWKVKRLVKQVVMSATYRQSSKVTPELLKRDPDNRLLARGARFRLPSLLLRDVALASSGLLNPAIGGKPVYPYQPAGIWDGLSITKERDFTYPQSHGSDLYRRSLYTFWRRTVAPGNMFDTSSRQACTVRASVTSTPLHALTTLNDVTWVEASRVLAENVLKGCCPANQFSEVFRRVCARRPSPEESRVLKRIYDNALAVFSKDPASMDDYLGMGERPVDPHVDRVKLAALTTVCLAVYNLDEAMTRE